MRVAVCDNDKNDLAPVSELLQKYSGLHPEYSIETSAFSSAMEMLCHAERRGCCDLFLLDIYMDGIDGVAAAKEIRELTKDSEIIFITASKDFALDAFALDAAQYIVKPCTENTLFPALDKVFARFTAASESAFTLKTTTGYTRIRPSEVIYTETSRNNYQEIHLLKDKTVFARITAQSLYDILANDDSFVRCGAAYNINLKHVRTVSKDEVTFDTGIPILIPHRAYTHVKEKFINYGMDIDF